MDRIINKKRWTLKKLTIIVVTVFFAVFVMYLLFFTDDSSRLYTDKDRLTVAVVEQASFQEFMPVEGTVQPIATIYLDAVLGGRVEEIFARDGAIVAEGEKILRLSNLSMEMQYIQQENHALEVLNQYQNTHLALEQNKFVLERQLTEIDYQLEMAVIDYKRKKALFDEDAISLETYENAEREYRFSQRRHDIALRTMKHDSLYTATQLASIRTSIERMQDNIRMLNRNLDNLIIRAPISGQLSSFTVERGETKTAGENLGQIDVTDGFKLRAHIDERYINRTFTGQLAELEYGGRTYTLEIQKIYSNITAGAFEVDMHFLDEEPIGIRRGQTIPLRLQFSGAADALIIPRGGFYQETGGNWIYVIDQTGKQAAKRRIRIGRQNIHHYEVLEGLESGEKVIVSSYDVFGGNDKLIFK